MATSSFSGTATAADADELLRSLLCLTSDLSSFHFPSCQLLRRLAGPFIRRAVLLAALFDGLVGAVPSPPSSSFLLCLRELRVSISRLNHRLADLACRSRTGLLLCCTAAAADARELALDIAAVLELLADAAPDVDCRELALLAARQFRRVPGTPDAGDDRLRSNLCATLGDIGRKVVPPKENLAATFVKLGFSDIGSWHDEIKRVEREIVDAAAAGDDERTQEMVAVVGLLRYGKLVSFGASPTPIQSLELPKASASAGDDEDPSPSPSPPPPPDMMCPVSLEVMRDPVVVVASGQTYDRESISRWFAAGRRTCPRTGLALETLDLVPNMALRNVITRWCRDNGVPFSFPDSTAEKLLAATAALPPNRAVLQVGRMTASFLLQQLAASPPTEAANLIVNEIRRLATSGRDHRGLVAEVGTIPLLVPLLWSGDAELQLNAVAALLILSEFPANKKRIMEADGTVEAVLHVMAAGATSHAKEEAAATVLSLADDDSLKRSLGQNKRIVELLVGLTRAGPAATKGALGAVLALAGEQENVPTLVECGVVEVAVAALAEEETAAAVLAAVAKRGAAEAVAAAGDSVERLVSVMRHGSERAQESAAGALLTLCRRLEPAAVAKVVAVPGLETAVWELMVGPSGSGRARRKAASLRHICRNWTAGSADCMANGTGRGSPPPAPEAVTPAWMAP